MFFFGSASTVLARSEAMLEKETIIIDCQNVKSMDISATFTLETMIKRLKITEDILYFCLLKK